MLAEKLGVAPHKKPGVTSPGNVPAPTPQRAKTNPGADLDKLLQDTLSGARKTHSSGIPHPAKGHDSIPERVPLSQPVLPPQPVAVQLAPEIKEEEPADGTRFGQYVMLERIASGGMAEVWKARKRGEEGFQKIVAIKKILPHLSDNQEFIEMFIDEAKLAAQLNHNNIIHIYDLGKIQNSYYIAMEYIDGHDLKTIIRRGEEHGLPLGVELALFVASKVAAALDYAHRKRDFDEKEMGLVHRDVSPQNVLVSEDGDIKLCDFGIAKAASKASHTQAGALKGKLQYMSPEQAWGHNIDRRSDIFALGAVLFELLTARKLFTGDSEMSILEQVRQARVTPPSEVNDEVTPEIDAVVLKALQKDPGARYQTAGEMAKDLEAVLYTFRPTPTSADLAIYMSRIWSPAPAPTLHDAPPVQPQPVAAPAAKAAVTSPGRSATPAAHTPAPHHSAMPSWEATLSRRKKKSRALPIVFALLIAGAITGGFLYFRSRNAVADAPGAQLAAAPVPAPVVRTPAETGTVVPVTDSTTTLQATDTTVTQAPVLDPNLVNEEVQRRLAAERARLEQQNRAQQQAQLTPPVRSAPVIPQPQPPAPQPTATVAPPPTATVAESRPAPQPEPQSPAPAQVREGDLVEPGEDGLIPARVIRYGTVPYPPMARAQRVSGTVVLRVLVDEKGQVSDVRMVSPLNRAFGLNEAAEQIIRRSTFAPPMLDGVRVKSWTTVPVKFTL